MSNKKKRKVISPMGSKNSKIIKLTIKENSVPNVFEDERENIEEKKLNSSDEIEIIIPDEKKNLEQSDQNEKKIESDTTPKKNLGTNKKLNRSQQKPGALTKFLKKLDKETENRLYELKDKQNCQNIFVHKDGNEICLNESSITQTNVSQLQNSPQENEQLKDVKIVSKSTDSLCQKADCDVTILSSDEDLSELDKSTLSGNEEIITSNPVTPVTPKTNKVANKKIIKLTPKQLEKREEIARRKEEKLRLKKVYMYDI